VDDDMRPTLDLETLHRLYAETHEQCHEAELLRRHERLALQLVRNFSHRGEESDDLCQVALLALVRALRKYDPDRGTKFSTYAVPSILGELKRHFRDRGWVVRPPRRIQEAYLIVSSAVEELGAEVGRAPTREEVAEHVGLAVSDVVEGLEASLVRRAVPLGALLERDDDRAVDEALSTDGGHSRAEEQLFVSQLVELLPKAERDVVILSFCSDLTQSEIAGVLGVSQSTVSRLRREALDRLRAAYPPV
jgi:RNA polymerase sigma-B factor